jgi:hypothetical protein
MPTAMRDASRDRLNRAAGRAGRYHGPGASPEDVMRTIGAVALVLLIAGAATAGPVPDGWHASLKDGAAAAKRSGKPLLVVTAWAPGV